MNNYRLHTNGSQEIYLRSQDLWSPVSTCLHSRSREMPRVDKQREKQGSAPYVKPHACLYCAAAFGEAGHLRTHVRTVHEKRRDHVCPHCVAVFGEASSLTAHVRVVHEKRKKWLDLLQDLRS